jgi:septum formation protein
VIQSLYGDIETANPDIDEKAYHHTVPSEKALMIATAKARALVERPQFKDADCILICGDQVVFCEGEIREKPQNAAEAKRFLQSYSNGQPGETVSAMVVVHPKTGTMASGVHISKAHFGAIPEEAVDQLIQEGDVFTCAGGFMIEHPLLKPHVRKIEGSIDSIQGLPIDLTKELVSKVCQQANIS